MELTQAGAADTADPLSELIEQQAHERRLTAHHEAGHLAVAWALGGHLDFGDIVPSGPYGGQAVFRMGDGTFGASVDRVIAILAGPMAQRRLCRVGDDGGERDRERVAEQLEALCRCPKAATIILRHCRAEAARLVVAEWDAVEAIAAAFLEAEALTSIELAEILADVVERRRRERWREVQARDAARPTTTEHPACPGRT